MEIRVGAIVYRVEQVEDLRDGDQKLNGWIKHNECLILLDSILSPQVERSVLWHEIIHAILEQAGFDEHDEQMIQALAYGILGVLSDHPELGEQVR